MTLTIASLALIASFSNSSALNTETNSVLPSKLTSFSKDEIVKILEEKQQENLRLEGFELNLHYSDINENTRLVKTNRKGQIRDLVMTPKTEISADE